MQAAPEIIEQFTRGWTADMLEQLPHVVGERHEIIDGELYVTTQPHARHQRFCQKLGNRLDNWSEQNVDGLAIQAPGLVYANGEAVAPDLVWVSKARLAAILGDDGKLHESPEIVVEVLSPGKANEERDRDKKLPLYARHGVPEYWIVDWQAKIIDVYRTEQATLNFVQRLTAQDELTSPQLPGFACSVQQLFEL